MGELADAVRAARPALRRVLLGRTRLDLQRPPDRLVRRSAGRPAPGRVRRATPRRTSESSSSATDPAFCGTTSRGRRQPAAGWPTPGRLLRSGARRRGQRPLHALVAAVARGHVGARCGTCSTATRPARRRRTGRAGAARSPRFRCAHAGVRRVRRGPAAPRGNACGAWTTASATTESSTGATSSRSDDLLWSLVDIAAKGGNLLLNVGPRGVDAQIAEAQLDAWTGWPASPTTWATPSWPPALGASVRAGPGGVEVRYTAARRPRPGVCPPGHRSIGPARRAERRGPEQRAAPRGPRHHLVVGGHARRTPASRRAHTRGPAG